MDRNERTESPLSDKFFKSLSRQESLRNSSQHGFVLPVQFETTNLLQTQTRAPGYCVQLRNLEAFFGSRYPKLGAKHLNRNSIRSFMSQGTK